MTEVSSCAVLSLRNTDKTSNSNGVIEALKSKNDTFQAQYSSFLKMKAAIDLSKVSAFSSVMQSFIVSIKHAVSLVKSNQSSKIPLCLLSCGFSFPDKEYIASLMKIQIEGDKRTYMLDIACNSVDSSHNLLIEVAEALLLKVVCLNVLSDRLAKTRTTVAQLRDNPLCCVEELLSLEDGLSSSGRPIIIYLKHAERINSVVLGHFLLTLSSSSLCNVSVVAMNSDMCPLPLPTDESALAAIAVSSHSCANSPVSLFDELVTEIYTSGEVPVLFPRSIMESTHKAFVEFNYCITSAVNRLLLCLSLHMEHRRSLLCLYTKGDWLYELQVVQSKAQRETVRGAFESLLSLMEPSDLGECGLLLSTEATEANWTQLATFAERLHLDKILFSCWKSCRSRLLRTVRQIHPLNLIWSGIFSSGDELPGSGTRVVTSMIGAINDRLQQLELREVLELVDNLRDATSVCKVHFLAGDPAVQAFEAHLRKMRNMRAVFYEIVELLSPQGGAALSSPSEKKAVGSSQHLSCSMRSSEGALDRLELGVKVHMTSGRVILGDDSDRNGGDGGGVVALSCRDLLFHAFADLLAWMEAAVALHRTLPRMPAVSRLLVIADEDVAAVRDCSDTNVQLKFAEALEKPHRFFPPSKSGSWSEEYPLRLDSSDLFLKYCALQRSVVANSWVYSMLCYGDAWKEPTQSLVTSGSSSSISGISSGNGKLLVNNRHSGDKKRKAEEVAGPSAAEEQEDDEDGEQDDSAMTYSATLRCRFAAALGDMERCGMVQCKRVAKGELVTVWKEMHTWMRESEHEP